MPLIATRGAASAQGFGEFGAVAGPAVYIEDVFSTYLYTGNSSTQTITNGIDLAGKGGLVWIKNRNNTGEHALFDSARGVGNWLSSNSTVQQYSSTSTTSFNADGFSLANGTYVGEVNQSTRTYVSWTFRKQAKFFDVVTYTGDGVAGRQISHNLGSTPGCIIIKNYSGPDAGVRGWPVWHRTLAEDYYLLLNNTNAQIFNDGFPPFGKPSQQTSTYFTVGQSDAIGVSGLTNVSGGTYVAYLFAHDAGGFGLTGTDNVISCGSFTSDSAGSVSVNIGYEPQWILYKTTAVADNWRVFDVMRGMPVDTSGSTSALRLQPNTSGAEASGNFYPTSTGFASTTGLGASQPYIYIAIRRGPMRVPTSGTSVFSPVVYAGTGANQTISGNFPSDLSIFKATNSNAISWAWVNRLAGGNLYLRSNSTAGEGGLGVNAYGQVQNGVTIGGDTETNSSSSGYVLDSVRRAPGFFDVVCYLGTGSNQNITHNLGVAPELIITKGRNIGTQWWVYSVNVGNTQYLRMDGTAAAVTNSTAWNNTSPTSTTFTVGSAGTVNSSGYTYVAYLFASCPGVSKVGSYTGTGTTKQIDCGFTGGARFVLIKRTDSTGDWYVWDSARGIVASTDPYLVLNSTAAEVTNTDWVDTYSAGFELSSAAGNNVNINGASYIFLSIA